MSAASEAIAAELALQRESGCVCDPDAEVVPCRSPLCSRVHVFVGHDDWCPLLRSLEGPLPMGLD